MDDKQLMDIERRNFANVYAKKDIVIVRGQGAKVWDSNGKEYIDCVTGYGVALLGHCHPKIVEAVQRQAERLIACHASTFNDARAEFVERIVKISPRGLEKVYLGNSGAEAVECAIKLAKKYTKRREIIAMMGAFHGKTMGALSATWDKKYRGPFEPLVPNFKHVPFGKPEKVREAMTKDTAAIIVEPIQGESGIRMPPEGYLKELREICDGKDMLLILDEVQTGFGRTGKVFACEHWGITPDILCAGKGLAGGLPVGATIARSDIMDSLRVGEHTTTFGGNPIVSAAGAAAIQVLIENKLPERAADLGQRLKVSLSEVKDRHETLREVRGLGLMIGIESRFDVLQILKRSMDEGVLVLDAGRNIVRLLPPLVIGEGEVDRVTKVLDGVIGGIEGQGIRS